MSDAYEEESDLVGGHICESFESTGGVGEKGGELSSFYNTGYYLIL